MHGFSAQIMLLLLRKKRTMNIRLLARIIFSGFLFVFIVFACNKEDELRPEDWAPQNFWVEDVSISKKKLSWDYYGSVDLDGFKLDRKIGEDDWEIAYQTFSKDTKEWTDIDIIPGNTVGYFYRLYAYKDNEISATIEIASTTNEIELTDFVIDKKSLIQVELSWHINSNLINGFKIERSYDDVNWNQISETSTSAYTDSTYDLGTNVHYRITAWADGYTSKPIKAYFFANFPAPENFKGKPNSISSVSLSWQYAYDEIQQFRIDRKTNESPWELNVAPLNPGQTSYTDNGLDIQNNNYIYRVYGFYYGFDSEKSDKKIDFACVYMDLHDERDGNIYETVLIGNQCWLKSNLKYLPTVWPPASGSETTPHYYVMYYSGTNVEVAKESIFYDAYGVLYNWPAANIACPDGWHLPTTNDFDTLLTYLGYFEQYSFNRVGGKLKSIRSTPNSHPRWLSVNVGATNSSGFTAYPGGRRRDIGTFHSLGEYGWWWLSPNEKDKSSQQYLSLSYKYEDHFKNGCSKEFGHSVRCLKDDY
jgi:uncharacterized protein (TIGR02145 family)